jgi:PAS domain S-box-containing protein
MEKFESNVANIFEKITDAIFITDNNGIIVFVNESCLLYFKTSSVNIIGKNIFLDSIELVNEELKKTCSSALSTNSTLSYKAHFKENNEFYEYSIHPYLNGLAIILHKKNNIETTVVSAELQNIQEKLRQSSERFELVTMATNDMIWDWDFNTNEVWWNYNFNKFFGYDLEKTHHHIDTWVKNIHDDDRARVVDSIYGVINSNNKYWVEEYRYLKKDGTILNIYDRGYVSHNAEGKPYRMIGSMVNITERIEATQAIKESEEKYRRLIEQASDAILITDVDGIIYSANTSACKMSGYSENELLKMSLNDLTIPDEIVKVPFHFEQIDNGKTIIRERTVKLKNGFLKNVESSSKILSDGRFLVFARDISDRIKAQNDILKQKVFSESIINSLPGIFYIHDEAGHFLKWNNNFENVFGYSNEEICGMNPLDFFGASEKAVRKKQITEIFNGATAQREINYLTKSKIEIPYQTVLTSIMFEDKQCIIAIGLDITEKRKSEELLKKSYEDIRNLASHVTKVREEERKRIGREIHDELGQQLTAIKMDVVWIDKKIPDENDSVKVSIKNILEIINGSNQSVRRILNELSPGVIDNFGLIEALEQQNQQFYISTGVSVKFESSVSELNLSQDIANTIFRVYQESLTNIIRYAQATDVETSLKIMDNSIYISIIDNGKGFNANANQSKKSFGILGMRERILSHNGSFNLNSELGLGTRISFVLPISI